MPTRGEIATELYAFIRASSVDEAYQPDGGPHGGPRIYYSHPLDSDFLHRVAQRTGATPQEIEEFLLAEGGDLNDDIIIAWTDHTLTPDFATMSKSDWDDFKETVEE